MNVHRWLVVLKEVYDPKHTRPAFKQFVQAGCQCIMIELSLRHSETLVLEKGVKGNGSVQCLENGCEPMKLVSRVVLWPEA